MKKRPNTPTSLVYFIPTALAFLFFLTSQSTAATPYLSEIKISTKYGKVIETYTDHRSPITDHRTIIHIQDLHSHYEAQKNIAHILEGLIKDHGVKLVLVEGGSGDDSLSFLRGEASLERRIRVAERYLKEGKMSGEEYLDLTSDYSFKIYGVETPELYDANMYAFLEVESFRKPVRRLIVQLGSVVRDLKGKIYNRPLLELERKARELDDKKIELSEYAKYISGLARKRRVGLSAYPNFNSFLDALHIEERIDFQKVEDERGQYIMALTKKLRGPKLNELLSKSRKFKQGEISSSCFYSYLEALGGANPVVYPSLTSYIKYVKAIDEIDAVGLFSEMRRLEDKVRESLYRNDAQKRLGRISKNLELLKNFLELKLSPEDYQYFQKNKEDFKVSAWLPFLKENGDKHGIAHRVPDDASVLDDNLEKLEDFYITAHERDEAFIQNAKKWMRRENETVAVLIAGGFHTDALKRLFRLNGFSYMVVAPKVTRETNYELYHKALKDKWTPGEWADRE